MPLVGRSKGKKNDMMGYEKYCELDANKKLM